MINMYGELYAPIARAQAEQSRISKRYKRGKATNEEARDACIEMVLVYVNASALHPNLTWRTRYARLAQKWAARAYQHAQALSISTVYAAGQENK